MPPAAIAPPRPPAIMPTAARIPCCFQSLTYLVIAKISFVVASPLAHAQPTTWLNATSGTATISTNYATTGGLTLNMGFYADYLIVGGGGGGGGGVYGSHNGGGGGAGEFVNGTSLLVSSSNYQVIVGTGGLGGANSGNDRGSNGGISQAFDLTALGGGGGGAKVAAGLSGGSGGGGAYVSGSAGASTAATGMGKAGGSGGGSAPYAGGGGGGAGQAGGSGTAATSRSEGGDGLESSITGSDVYYAGGGAGWVFNSTASGGLGGGASSVLNGSAAGTSNTGGGGSGGGPSNPGNFVKGGDGGSGIVIIRYSGPSVGAIGGTVTRGSGTAAGSTLHTFTTPGTSAFNLGTVDFNQRLGATLTGTISGASGSVTYNGPGRLALAADNSYAGTTTISAGTLIAGDGGTTGSLGAGAVTNNAALGFNRSDSVTVANAISGTGSLTQEGVGTMVLTGSNTYSGATAITAGTLQVGDGGTAGTLGGTGTVTNDGTLAMNRSDAVMFGRPITGAGGFRQLGTGTTTLTGANSYTGGTVVAAGRLIGSTASLPGAIDNASQLEFAQALTGTYSDAISGTGSLTKTGDGNLILAGTSTYTGATSVAAGRLSVNGALGTTPVAVLAAAELGGSGSIAGPVSIDARGTLSPGNSIQSLATGTATFAAGATFEYEVDSTDLGALAAAADLLVVTGGLNLDPGNGTLLTFLDLNGSPNPFVEDTTIFALINYSGSWNGGLFTYGTNELSDGERFSVGSQLWEIDYNRTSSTGLDNFTADYLPSSSFVTVTAVPEPSTIALAGLGTLILAFAAQRRRRVA